MSVRAPRVRHVLHALAVLLFAPTFAHGQEAWVGVNAGGQFGSTAFAHTVEVPLFRTAVRAEYPVGNGGVFDLGGGVTLPWSVGLGPIRLGIGASFSVASVGADATVRAEIHSALAPGVPFRFDGIEPFDRSEKGNHLQVAAVVPVSGRTTLSVYGGPSYFAVSQDVISEVEIPAAGTSVLGRAEVREVHANWWGFNAGADIAFFFTERLGLGLGVRVTGATVRIENALLSTIAAQRGLVASRAGGGQVLGGLRVRLR